MAINGISSFNAGLSSSLLSSLGTSTGVASAGDSAGGSSFGPAFIVGGSAQATSSGLYSSLAPLLSTSTGTASLPKSAAQAESEKLRGETLRSAAQSIQEGDFAAGRKRLDEVLERNASDVSAIRILAFSYMEELDYEQAEQIYSRALALAPGNAVIRSEFEDSRTLQKSDDDVLSVARGKLKNLTQRSEGLQLLVKLTNRSPDNVEAYLAIAEVANNTNDLSRALGALQEAVRSADPRQLSRVIEEAEKVVEKRPDVGLAHNLLGRALQKAGRTREAVVELKAAADIAPYNISYRSDVASALAGSAQRKLDGGDVLGAESDLQSAQTFDLSNGQVRETTARVAAAKARRDLMLDRPTKSLASLHTAATKAPDDKKFKQEVAGLFILAAGKFEAKGDTAVALNSYIKAYELDATSTTAQDKVAELSHARGLNALSSSNYDIAIDHLKRAYETVRLDTTYVKDLANAYDQRGQQRLLLKETADAIEDFVAGLALDPSNASLGTNYANALQQQIAGS